MKGLLVVYASVCFVGAVYSAAVDSIVKESVTTDLPTPLQISEECYQPREIGRCFALFHRFAFNVETNRCEEFIYGGCGANDNNFETQESCERKCLLSLGETTEFVSSTTEVPNFDFEIKVD